MAEETEDKFHLNTFSLWAKTIFFLAVLLAINVVAFLVSFGVGVIVTLPLTLFMAFLLLRDMWPKHRFPPGRPRQEVTP